jgi:hypothetical protein
MPLVARGLVWIRDQDLVVVYVHEQEIVNVPESVIVVDRMKRLGFPADWAFEMPITKVGAAQVTTAHVLAISLMSVKKS